MSTLTIDFTGELVRKAYRKILPVQILSLVVSAVNSFADGIITSNYLGTQAMAAIGFFSPVCTFAGISFVICMGVQILASRLLGSRDKKGSVTVFSTGFVFLTVFSLLCAFLCVTFKEPLSSLLGAEGETKSILQSYITGYAPGLIGQILSGMLMVFLPMNNNMKRSYAGIIVMVTTNVGLDVLFVTVFRLGAFGMGLASSVSYTLSALVMLTGFFNREKAVNISLSSLDFKKLPSVMYLGLPSLMFTLGCTVKAYILNRTLMLCVGDAAVAAMNVQNTLCSLLGSIPGGFAGAFIALGSMYYGEQDRLSFSTLTSYSLKLGALVSAAVVLALMVFSGPVSSVFFKAGDPAWAICRRMMLLFPLFLVFNTVFNILLKVYMCQKKMGLVNFLSIAENIFIAAFSAVFASLAGTDAVWLSFPVCDLVCLLIIAVSVFIRAEKLTLKTDDWMKLDKTFGFNEDECLDFTVDTEEEVLGFCREKGIDKRRALFSGLCIEEMAGNIVRYGFRENEKHRIDIRVIIKGELTLRIRDDCREFDPGINTLLIKLSPS